MPRRHPQPEFTAARSAGEPLGPRRSTEIEGLSGSWPSWSRAAPRLTRPSTTAGRTWGVWRIVNTIEQSQRSLVVEARIVKYRVLKTPRERHPPQLGRTRTALALRRPGSRLTIVRPAGGPLQCRVHVSVVARLACVRGEATDSRRAACYAGRPHRARGFAARGDSPTLTAWQRKVITQLVADIEAELHELDPDWFGDEEEHELVRQSLRSQCGRMRRLLD